MRRPLQSTGRVTIRGHPDRTGTGSDYAEAVKWFRKAAYQGHPLAQLNLGNSYAEGRGVLNLAAAKDRNQAEKMTPAQIAEAQRLAKEQKPK